MNSNISFSISVRELAEFVWRSGDLKHGRDGPSAQEGARAHRRLQKARVGYHSEVPLSWLVARSHMKLTVSGRADLVADHGPAPVIEEIKTTLQSPLLIDGGNPVHWAQVKLYGYMYAVSHHCELVNLQVTYFNPETDVLRTFSENATKAALAEFFDKTTDIYLEWMTRVIAWRRTRNRSLASLRFPFDTPRPGQEPLAESVSILPDGNQKLFVEAPTGSGKTMAVLWGAMAALEQGKISQLLFLTARSMGRGAALDAGQQLRNQGASLKILTLFARDVLCVSSLGAACSAEECPLAKGHFDRVRDAMNELFAAEDTSRETVESVANAHRVCPYWLSRTLLPYADLVIGDYNYFFDPGATLLTLTAPASPPRLLLVDEAHNLPDRARQMFSASLSTNRLARATRHLDKTHKGRYAFARRCLNQLTQMIDQTDSEACPRARPANSETKTVLENGLPEAVAVALEGVIDAVNASLASVRESIPAELLSVYFDCLAFSRAVSGNDDGDRLILARDKYGVSLTHFCVDPAPKLKRVFDKSKARVVFFSATLSPTGYYRRILGGDISDQCNIYPSHFPPERRCVSRSINITTRYRDRSRTREKVAAMIRATVLARPGNYLAFFPSFAYLATVAEVLNFENAKVDVLAQKPGLNDSEKQTFLKKFRTRRRTRHLLGLAVLGGLFSEAVDLPGHQLIGAMVVSPGLPMVSFERSLIQDHFEQTEGKGFEFAYIYPGMNKVIQAAGRVHRSANDQGVIAFIGQRFATSPYAPLLEDRWPEIANLTSEREWRDLLHLFWKE